MATHDIAVRPLTATDHAGWAPLWQGYLEFYETVLADEVTDATWARVSGGDAAMGGLVAEDEVGLVGLAHYVVHPTTWTVAPACYLEDLFVVPQRRSQGLGRALIEQLAALGREQGWSGIHWLTGEDNVTGMRLYDRVATRTNWVRYELDLPAPPAG